MTDPSRDPTASPDDPLRIDFVVAPRGGSGRIGMCACPGGRRIRAAQADIAATLEADVAAIREWGAGGVVSLIEQEEFEVMTVTSLPTVVAACGLWWRHLPIPDMQPPPAEFERRWREEGARLRHGLRRGESFVLHCWAGLGRTGTVAARLLVELGAPPLEAIAAVRLARAGAIQTVQQTEHVLACRAVTEER